MSTERLVLLASLYLVGFALLHSIPAMNRVKSWAEPRLGRGYALYRLVYNLVQVAILLGYVLLFDEYDRLVYRVDGVWRWVLRGSQAASGILIIWSLFFTFDWKTFFGFRHLKTLRDPTYQIPDTPLNTRGPYRLCRHPLYLATVVLVWCEPRMSVLTMVAAVFVVLYALVGSVIEERRLLGHYGDEYAQYQRTTKRLIPFVL